MRDCIICYGQGRGNGLCPKHHAEAMERAARYNISMAEAVDQLYQQAIADHDGSPN